MTPPDPNVIEWTPERVAAFNAYTPPKTTDRPGAKYRKPFGRGDCRHDVYDVLDAFGVTCPATAHAVKKCLMAGQRGHKDRLTDLQEAAVALTRAVELEVEGAK